MGTGGMQNNMKSWRFWVFLFVLAIVVSSICRTSSVFSTKYMRITNIASEDGSSSSDFEDDDYTEFA